MLEKTVEARLKRLEQYGFKVLKLRTPGVSGVPDRMILRPNYSPGPPSFVELKAPGKYERALQLAVKDEWVGRGVLVHPVCDTICKVDELVFALLELTGWVDTVAGWHHPLKHFDIS